MSAGDAQSGARVKCAIEGCGAECETGSDLYEHLQDVHGLQGVVSWRECARLGTAYAAHGPRGRALALALWVSAGAAHARATGRELSALSRSWGAAA